MKIIFQMLLLANVVIAPQTPGQNQRDGKSNARKAQEKEKAAEQKARQEERKRKREMEQREQREREKVRKRLRAQGQMSRETIPVRKVPQAIRTSVIFRRSTMTPLQHTEVAHNSRTEARAVTPKQQKVLILTQMYQKITEIQYERFACLKSSQYGNNKSEPPSHLSKEQKVKWVKMNEQIIKNTNLAYTVERDIVSLIRRLQEQQYGDGEIETKMSQLSQRLNQLSGDLKALIDQRKLQIEEAESSKGQVQMQEEGDSTNKEELPGVSLLEMAQDGEQEIQPPSKTTKRIKKTVDPKLLLKAQSQQDRAFEGTQRGQKRRLSENSQDENSDVQQIQQTTGASKKKQIKRRVKLFQREFNNQLKFQFVNQNGKIIIDDPFKQRCVSFQFNDYLFTPADAFYTTQRINTTGRGGKKTALKLTKQQVELLELEIVVLFYEALRLRNMQMKLKNKSKKQKLLQQQQSRIKQNLQALPKLVTAVGVQIALKRFLLSGCIAFNKFRMIKAERQYAQFTDNKLKKYIQKKTTAILSLGYLQEKDLQKFHKPSSQLKKKLKGAKRLVERRWDYLQPKEASVHVLTEKEKTWRTQGTVNQGQQQQMSQADETDSSNEMFETYSAEEDD